MARIRLENVTKRFGEITALNGVSLDIADGEFFAVLGPPGRREDDACCGRSSGSSGPTRATSTSTTTAITDIYPGDRNIAIVFQNLALYPDKTVFNNLAFPLRQAKVPKDEIRRRVQAAAEKLHIERLLDRKPAKLSGGERQRVALGRALVRDPSAFLFDEPLSALDALLRLEMRAELKRLQQEVGQTLVYVTHDQVEALSMADRIARAQPRRPPAGRHARDDLPPAGESFVATVVGNPPMNFIPARVAAQNGRLRVEHEAFAVESPAALAGSADLAEGGAVPGRHPARGRRDRGRRRGDRGEGVRDGAARRRDGRRPHARREGDQGARARRRTELETDANVCDLVRPAPAASLRRAPETPCSPPAARTDVFSVQAG